jgi:hypothetical protein
MSDNSFIIDGFLFRTSSVVEMKKGLWYLFLLDNPEIIVNCFSSSLRTEIMDQRII